MGWLQGEVALITGGGSGLGWALVERFLEEGAQVAVLQRSKAKVDALNEHFGGKVLAIEGDVASYADNVRAVQATVERFGKLDCFVGNAGIWDHYADIVNTSGEQLEKAFDEIMGINTKSLILGAKLHWMSSLNLKVRSFSHCQILHCILQVAVRFTLHQNMRV